jgi:hypothetical protein
VWWVAEVVLPGRGPGHCRGWKRNRREVSLVRWRWRRMFCSVFSDLLVRGSRDLALRWCENCNDVKKGMLLSSGIQDDGLINARSSGEQRLLCIQSCRGRRHIYKDHPSFPVAGRGEACSPAPGDLPSCIDQPAGSPARRPPRACFSCIETRRALPVSPLLLCDVVVTPVSVGILARVLSTLLFQHADIDAAISTTDYIWTGLM